jgi:hypothetical protein
MSTKELRRLAEAATPGPWHTPGMGEIHRPNHDSIAQICFNGGDEDDDSCGTEADGTFIAAANPAAIIELLDELDAANAEIAALKQDAARYQLACSLDDNAELLYIAVINHSPDINAISAEFDAGAALSTKGVEG